MIFDDISKMFPFTLWQGSMSHFGFINIYQTGSKDRELEKKIIE